MRVTNENNWYSIQPKKTESSFNSNSLDVIDRLKSQSLQKENRSFIIKKKKKTP